MNRDSKVNDRRVDRNLSKLEISASTSRVMNLAVSERLLVEAPQAMRIFDSPTLNKSIILKHTLRPHERELFTAPRKIGTKVIFPFDFNDLKLGGTALFLRQRDFERDREQFFRVTGASNRDAAILNVLEALPSLDPFLVKEHCARAGLLVPAERLSLSPGDILRMQAFAQEEIARLIAVAFPNFNANVAEKFSRKILADKPDETMRPLMDTLRMTDEEFWDGVFSWRGFLYYKWRMTSLTIEVDELFSAVQSYQPVGGAADKNLIQYVRAARPRILGKLTTAVRSTKTTIDVYNDAFDAMIERDDAVRFKKFLLNGPKLFLCLGEQVGLLDHFTSLWRFRVAEENGKLTAMDYADFLIDLDESLTAVIRPGKARRPASEEPPAEAAEMPESANEPGEPEQDRKTAWI